MVEANHSSSGLTWRCGPEVPAWDGIGWATNEGGEGEGACLLVLQNLMWMWIRGEPFGCMTSLRGFIYCDVIVRICSMLHAVDIHNCSVLCERRRKRRWWAWDYMFRIDFPMGKLILSYKTRGGGGEGGLARPGDPHSLCLNDDVYKMKMKNLMLITG